MHFYWIIYLYKRLGETTVTNKEDKTHVHITFAYVLNLTTYSKMVIVTLVFGSTTFAASSRAHL